MEQKVNKKAAKFKGRDLKQAAAEAIDTNSQSIDGLRYVLQNISVLLLGQKRDIDLMKAQQEVLINRARNADFRSSALVEILMASGAVTKEQVTEAFVKLQVKEFEEGSALHDQEANLEAASGQAEVGMHAILTAKLLKDGVEQAEEQVLRSKIELGKDELFKGFDASVLSKQVGDTVTVQVETDYGPREVQATLLGLRKVKPQVQASEQN